MVPSEKNGCKTNDKERVRGDEISLGDGPTVFVVVEARLLQYLIPMPCMASGYLCRQCNSSIRAAKATPRHIGDTSTASVISE